MEKEIDFFVAWELKIIETVILADRRAFFGKTLKMAVNS